jgi:hypothetical protein
MILDVQLDRLYPACNLGSMRGFDKHPRNRGGFPRVYFESCAIVCLLKSSIGECNRASTSESFVLSAQIYTIQEGSSVGKEELTVTQYTIL